MKILTIGGATQDVFIHYQDGQMIEFHTQSANKSYLLLQEGSKIEVSSCNYSTGGGATNSATSFKRLGFTVSTFFKTGNDPQAQFIIEKLHKEGINTDLVLSRDKEQTGISYILPTVHGDRTILAYRGANATLVKKEFPLDTISNYNLLYITSLSGKSSELLAPIAKTAKRANILVANNPGSSQLCAGAAALKECLPYIDIFILNAQEAQQLMDSLCKPPAESSWTSKKKSEEEFEKLPKLLACSIANPHNPFVLVEYFKKILQEGPKIAVVTNGADGVYVATKDAIYFHSGLPATVVNTIGAGDAFGSAFVAAIAQGISIQKAIVQGCINSASVISHLTAKEGLLTKEEMAKRMQEVGTERVQKFSFHGFELSY